MCGAGGVMLPSKIQPILFSFNGIRRAVAKDGSGHIMDRDGNPNVFNLNSNGDQLKLNGNHAKPENRWNADNKFVFRFRKTFLFPALYRAVFLFRVIQTIFPATKHTADFIQFLHYFFKFIVRNKLGFPSDRNKIFERI